MSIHEVRDGWEIRWREGGRGARQRARFFDKATFRKSDVVDFRDELRRRKRLGTVTQLDSGTITLAEMGEEWWRLHAAVNLKPNTRKAYASMWDTHVLPRLGDHQLRELQPSVLQHFRVQLGARGVGNPTIRKTLALIQSVLRLAVLQGRIESNPVIHVMKPPQLRTHEVRPLEPDVVERIRDRLRTRDATLVSVMAYAGLGPEEALLLTWGCVRQRTLLVENAEELKTGAKRVRTVVLLPPLAQDLAEWQLLQGRPPAEDPVFPRADGKPWRDHDYRNWRKRVYKPAAAAVGIARARPYDLRHSFVSLLIREGKTLPEVARQAGHSVQTCLSTYMHCFDEFDPAQKIGAEFLIRRARDRIRQPSLLEVEEGGAS